MPELLLELGCEELPASFVRKALADLTANVEQALKEAEVPFQRENGPIGTPRRLIVCFKHVEARQPDRTKEVRGPGAKAAFDAEGKPTKALEGFCRGQGVDPATVRTEGDYVWVTKSIPGLDTAELLKEILPKAITSLTFEKAMRWGASRMRFARPIRWILAAFDGKAIPFQIETAKSGLESRGHRFNHPEPFEAKTYDELLKKLREREVEPDPAIREKRIREGAVAVCSGQPELTDALVDENVFLTEWPTAIEGEFDAQFLSLPEPVLVTAMAKHERFFPVRGTDDKITNRFISIRNGGVDDVVRAGNAWVLNARFNDALFFFNEDRKSDLDVFLAKTEGILFQDKLGTVRKRADRLSSLAATLAEETGADESEIEIAKIAGLYCKADLSTGLVSELPSLQGIIGGEYAERHGLPHSACCAIGKHYDLAKIPQKDCEGSRTARRILAADQLDKLAGYLGIGLAPSGSSDPYGLRRAATMLIEVAWSWEGDYPSYNQLLRQAEKAYRAQGIELDHKAMLESAATLFASRYPVMLPSVRYDLLEAALIPDQPWQALDPLAVRLRTACMENVAEDVSFIQTATRPINIVNAAIKKGIDIPEAKELDELPLDDLKAEEGAMLASVVRDIEHEFHAALQEGDAKRIVASLKDLQTPINSFFDATMVMVDEERIRDARLALLNYINGMLYRAGDFTRIVIEGE
jgi:glycyl-tRNA synthetase beta chain